MTGCNELRGTEVNGPLAEALRPLRHTLCIRSGSGDDPPTIRAVESQYGVVDIGIGKAQRTRVKWPEVVVEADDRRTIAINARTTDEAVRQLVHGARRIGLKTKEQFLKMLELPTDLALHVQPFTESVQLRTSVGDPRHFRSIAKSALEVFALVEPTAARGDGAVAVRNYVLHGEGKAPVNWTLDQFGDLPFSEAELGVFPNVVTVVARQGTPALGHVTIFGHLHFLVRLTNEWSGDEFAVSLAVDPMLGRNCGLRRHAKMPLPIDLARLDFDHISDEAFIESWSNFIAKASRAGYWRHLERYLSHIIERLTAEWPSGTILDDEYIAQLANACAHAIWSANAGRSEPIDHEDFRSRAVELFEKLCKDDI